MATNRWYQFADEYLRPIELVEKKKRETTIAAHKKDQVFYTKHQIERVRNKTVEKMDTRSEEAHPLAPANLNRTNTTEVGIDMAQLEQEVTNHGQSSSNQINMVNMSGLEPIQLQEGYSQQSKNLLGQDQRRRSPRTSSIYPVKT